MTNSNSSTKMLAIVLAGCILAFVALIGVSYVSAYNTANSLEQSIKATYQNNQSILAQYGLKIQEAAQVTDMARNDIGSIIKDTLQGRYGDQGVQAVVTAIKEQNPSVPPELYTKLQQLIEAGRNEFTVAQTRLIDQKRVYETQLGSFWTGMFMRMAGYPKINLDDYKIITSERATKTFETGVDTPIQLRPAK